MTFRVNQKVVCIDEGVDTFLHKDERQAVKGQVYTIRGMIDAPEGLGLYLAEIVNPPKSCSAGFVERAHNANFFRPIVERKTDTGFAILTEILNGQRVPEKVS